MQRLGAEALSEAELVSLLVGGRDQGRSEAVGAALVAGGLAQLRALKPGRHCPGARIGPTQLERLQVALELGRRTVLASLPERASLLDPADLCAHLLPRLAHLEREEFWAILLTARLEELQTVRISLGGITHCSLLPREAFSPAVMLGAPCIAFAHNHPSGDAQPSAEDVRLQGLLDDAGHVLGVEVIDHLVITARGHHSARHGLLSLEGEPLVAPDDTARPVEPRPLAFKESRHSCPRPR